MSLRCHSSFRFCGCKAGSLLRAAGVFRFLFFNLTQGTAGVAYGQRMGWDVVSYHAARTDDGPFANGHPRQDDHIAAYPHVVADADRVGILHTCVALGDVQRMAGSVDAYVGSDEYVVTDVTSAPSRMTRLVLAKKLRPMRMW